MLPRSYQMDKTKLCNSSGKDLKLVKVTEQALLGTIYK